MPYDIKQTCIWLVRGYERRVRNYLCWREDIIHSSPCLYTTYIQNGEECRQYFGHGSSPGKPIENKQEQLEAIEGFPETQRMRAVEQALVHIGNDLQNEELRQKLKEGIYLNCQNRKQYPFELLGIDGISRMSFYRRKDKFLIDIAEYLNLF